MATDKKYFFGMILGFLAFRFMPISLPQQLAMLLAIAIALAIGYPVGWLVGRYVAGDADTDSKGYRIAALGNLVLWLIPFVGVMMSVITSQFARRADYYRALHQGLATLGMMLAIGHAAFGAYVAVEERRQFATTRSEHVASSVRSTERCPYAAIEAWSQEDVDTYCKRRR